MSDVRNGQFTRSTNFLPGRGDRTQPLFHTEAVYNELASAKAGHPVFIDEERVKYVQPGSLNQPVFRVTDEHRRQWPDQYAQFKKGIEQSANGTPLEQWPALTVGMVKTLKALDIVTIEQCAELTDTAVQRVGMGGYNLRERAKAYLDDAAAMALTERLSRESELKDAQIAQLSKQVDELSQHLTRLSARVMEVSERPNAVASYNQSLNDPFEAARMGAIQQPVQQTALDSLAPVRRGPGRPRKEPLDPSEQAA